MGGGEGGQGQVCVCVGGGCRSSCVRCSQPLLYVLRLYLHVTVSMSVSAVCFLSLTCQCVAGWTAVCIFLPARCSLRRRSSGVGEPTCPQSSSASNRASPENGFSHCRPLY